MEVDEQKGDLVRAAGAIVRPAIEIMSIHLAISVRYRKLHIVSLTFRHLACAPRERDPCACDLVFSKGRAEKDVKAVEI